MKWVTFSLYAVEVFPIQNCEARRAYAASIQVSIGVLPSPTHGDECELVALNIGAVDNAYSFFLLFHVVSFFRPTTALADPSGIATQRLGV